MRAVNELEGTFELPAKNPRKKANVISILLFSWLDSLIWTGYKRELKQEDLYATPDNCRSQKLLREFKRYWDPEFEKQRQNPRLWLALLKYFNRNYFYHGILFFIKICLFILQAVLVGYLSQYFCEKNTLEKELVAAKGSNNTQLVNLKENEIQIITRNAYLYAAGIAIIGFLTAVIIAWLNFLAETLGMKHRILFIAAIYEKVLHLSHSTIGKLSIGHIVNIASTDVQRFDLGFTFIHLWWIFLISMPLMTYLLWRELGPSCLVGVGLILIQAPLQYAMARSHGRIWLKSAKLTDKRVRVMNEIISGMRLIKMYAWEWAFHEYVKNIRTKESKSITQASLIRGLNQACFSSLLSILNFVTFSTYAGLGNVLTPRKVFTVITLFTIMRQFFYYFLVLSTLGMSEMWVSLKRIEKLLVLPELGSTIKAANIDPVHITNDQHSYNGTPACKLVNKNNCSTTELLSSEVRISICGLTASWIHDEDKLVLNDINFTVSQCNRLLAIVGPVGSGKSSLLQCLLGELQPLNGSVDIEGTVSYASQEPWIFSGTLKENILFGKPFDQAWFERVVECCCLVKDINEMPFGDETLIGERGVNLSGGQKARVNLARAVYRDSEIILLDDPLSAVDAAVSRHLFDRCICGVLADKIVILVTHQLQYAQYANSILVLKEGRVQGYGDYKELTSSGIDPKELFDDVKDSGNLPHSITTDIDSIAKDCNVRAEETNQQDVTNTIDAPSIEEPKRYAELRHFKGDLDSSFNQAMDEGSICTTPSMYSLISMPNISSCARINVHSANVVPEEERAHGTISAKTYFMFFKEGVKSHLVTIILLFFFIFVEGCLICADWWLANWASETESCLPEEVNFTVDSSSAFSLSTHQRIGIYGGIVTFSFIFVIMRAVLCYLIILAASRSLHSKMLTAILRAPILFFDTNPVGRVLNRFSKDIGFIDAVLPYQSVDFLNYGLRCVAIVVTACVANYWLSVVVIILLTLLVLFRHYFLHSSRNIQRLEALARSPIYSHISTTIQGLSTIRAYGEQIRFLNNLHFYQNEHTKGWSIKVATTRWFGMKLDMFGALFLSFVVFTSIPLSDVLDPAFIGLSLAYTVSLSGLLQYTVRLSAEVEHLMVSVERVTAYGKLENERELETFPKAKAPPTEWPERGEIELRDVNFKYAMNYPYVLKSTSLKIHSHDKIGIVGRTGAGKSSLLSALFRLAEPEGVFEIDGIQITKIGLHDLRKKISIIPQDPVLFSGTVRYNLDPFKEYQDYQLWDALEEVQLKEVITNMMDDGLEAEVSEGGSNFSVGQRQLMCLARALLRRNKILVIDEATANVDLITDGIIQEMIRTKFSHCTILTIAHRLETIMDSDRVLVLSFGKVIEFDTPFNLLQKHDSVFHSMVKKTGVTESERLNKIAVTVENFKYGTRL